MAEIAGALERNTVVTRLYLESTEVESAGMRAVVRLLERNSSITELTLGEERIDVESARLLGEALAGSTSITRLRLRGNRLGDEGAIALAPGLARITTLDLSENGLGERGVAAIAEAIERGNVIADLDLSENALGDSGGQVLGRALERCTRLTSLELSDTDMRSAQGIASGLAKSKSLLKLGLNWNAIGDAGAMAIAKALEGNASVAMLDLAENGITRVGARAFAMLLEKSSTLVDLDLSHNLIGEGADTLCKALETNTTLISLSIKSCEITDGRAIANMLEKNASLATLDIDSNNLSAESTEAICAALTGNSSLTSLNASQMHIGLKVAQKLATALETNKSLVSWPQRSFSGDGLEKLLAALKQNHVLTTIKTNIPQHKQAIALLARNEARRARFVEALLHGSLDEARQFVEEGVDLHSSVDIRQSILLAVLEAGRLDSFEMLLQTRFARSLLFSMNSMGYGVPVVVRLLQDESWRFPRHEGIMARLWELVGNNSSLAGMLGQLDCRHAARALYAVLRKRFKVAWCEDNPPKHIPRDMARMLAQRVWQSRFAWSEHSANAVRSKRTKHQ